MSAPAHSNGHGEASSKDGLGRTRLEPRPDAPQSAWDETSLRDVYRIIFRHRGKVTGFIVVTMVAAFVYAFASPKEYRSEAKLFIRLGRENVGLDATTTLGQAPTVAIPLSREEELNTVVEVLGSSALLAKVVDAVGPEAILDPPKTVEGQSPAPAAPAPTGGGLWETIRRGLESIDLLPAMTPAERALALLKRQIVVETVKKTNVLLVAHEGPSPAVSQQIVNKLIDFYLDEHVRMNRTPRAHQFLGQQSASVKAHLNQLENELRLLKNNTGLASPAEQRQILVTQIGRLEDDLKAAQSTAAATEAEMRQLGLHVSALSPTQVLGTSEGFPNVAADGMLQQLYALQLREKELASRVTDNHVELKFIREQIAGARSVVDVQQPTRTQVTTGPNRTFEEMRLTQLRQQATLASLRAKSGSLEQQLASARQQLRTLNDNELRIAALQREVQISDGSYRKYSDSLEQARIDESLERARISNINVAQQPTRSTQPVRPKKLVALLGGFVFAIFGGFCLAMAAEYLDHTFKTSDDIEGRLNLPVLVSIPQLRRRHLVVRR